MSRQHTRTYINDAFPAGFLKLSKSDLEAFSEKHRIASTEGLAAALNGIAISAHAGRRFGTARVPTRVASRHLQAISATAAKLDKLLNEDNLLAYSLMFNMEEALDSGRDLKSQLSPALKMLRKQVEVALLRLKSGQLVSPYVHNKRGRPLTEKHEWLRELLRFFQEHSSGKTILSSNPKVKSKGASLYSGDFFFFSKDFCEKANLSTSDEDLAKSIKRIVLQNK